LAAVVADAMAATGFQIRHALPPLTRTTPFT